ncbi:hypothetical protein G6F60_015493 [Rhizopus arrhizus]|nr:hypothetical protein G6F60_015493 [Rhizopus arrhizus]
MLLGLALRAVDRIQRVGVAVRWHHAAGDRVAGGASRCSAGAGLLPDGRGGDRPGDHAVREGNRRPAAARFTAGRGQ